jgi:hypothetical protein
MTNLQELGAATTLALPQNLRDMQENGTSRSAGGAALFRPGDAIRRTGPRYWRPPADMPQSGGFSGVSGMNGVLSQLLSILRQLLSMMGMGANYFQSATASSTGDPHLAFTGTTAGGSAQQSHFDSMTSHGDLLDSDSFAGGYRVSTEVTAANANGVTFNRSAAIATNFGATQVSLDNTGRAAITQNGRTISLANGQTVFLGDGESATRSADGSVVVTDGNAMGGTITATLRENGQGVDVKTQANNVDLGGDLVNH